jgi:hypothetical protein
MRATNQAGEPEGEKGVGLKVSGVRFQVSAQSPAKKTAGLIEKETLKKRIPACHA